MIDTTLCIVFCTFFLAIGIYAGLKINESNKIKQKMANEVKEIKTDKSYRNIVVILAITLLAIFGFGLAGGYMIRLSQDFTSQEYMNEKMLGFYVCKGNSYITVDTNKSENNMQQFFSTNIPKAVCMNEEGGLYNVTLMIDKNALVM